MSQREKEETEFKAPKTLTMCVNNCGLPGNPATKNMCKNCFRSVEMISSPPFSGQIKASAACSASSEPLQAVHAEKVSIEKVEIVATSRYLNRCSTCRKKVGLTGFRCRCGDLFCGTHRYSDRHDCSFDYRAAAKDAIARENPVVKAAKIVKI